jgi:hypothetical protein
MTEQPPLQTHWPGRLPGQWPGHLQHICMHGGVSQGLQVVTARDSAVANIHAGPRAYAPNREVGEKASRARVGCTAEQPYWLMAWATAAAMALAVDPPSANALATCTEFFLVRTLPLSLVASRNLQPVLGAHRQGGCLLIVCTHSRRYTCSAGPESSVKHVLTRKKQGNSRAHLRRLLQRQMRQPAVCMHALRDKKGTAASMQHMQLGRGVACLGVLRGCSRKGLRSRLRKGRVVARVAGCASHTPGPELCSYVGLLLWRLQHSSMACKPLGNRIP